MTMTAEEKLQSAMSDAVYKRDWSRVLIAVMDGANPQDHHYAEGGKPAGGGLNALLGAISDNRLDVAKALLRLGADPNPRTSAGDWGSLTNPLETVIAHNDRLDAIAAIDMLVEAGTLVDGRDCRDGTVLALAAQWGLTKILERLLYHGADPNTQDDRGHTALHTAVNYGQHAAVKLLMEHGADPSIRNKAGFKPAELLNARQDHALSALLTVGAAREQGSGR